MKWLRGWQGSALLAALVVAAPGMARSQDAGGQPAVAGGVEIEALVKGIEGAVDVMRPDDKDWVPAEVGMKLAPASQISTGPDSTALLAVGDNVEVTVGPLTQGEVARFAVAGDTQQTKMKLDIGSMKVEVKKGTLKTDLKVATPNSTASVSGSAADIEYFPDTGTGVSCTDDACTLYRNLDTGDRGGDGGGGGTGEGEEEGEEEETLGEGVEIMVGEQAGVTEDTANSDELIFDVDIIQEEVVIDTLPIGTTDEEAEASMDSGTTDVSGADVNSDDSSQGSMAEDVASESTDIIEETLPPEEGGSGGSGDDHTSDELPAPPSPPQ